MGVLETTRARTSVREKQISKPKQALDLPIGQILDGDCVERLRELPDASVDVARPRTCTRGCTAAARRGPCVALASEP